MTATSWSVHPESAEVTRQVPCGEMRDLADFGGPTLRLTAAHARSVTLADLAARLLRLLEATESKDPSRVDSRRHLPVPLAVSGKSVEPLSRPREHRCSVHVLRASEPLERH